MLKLWGLETFQAAEYLLLGEINFDFHTICLHSI